MLLPGVLAAASLLFIQRFQRGLLRPLCIALHRLKVVCCLPLHGLQFTVVVPAEMMGGRANCDAGRGQ